jgi:hypothetical protein
MGRFRNGVVITDQVMRGYGFGHGNRLVLEKVAHQIKFHGRNHLSSVVVD